MKVAVIIARGGSKRIPRKNIKLFHGLPIMAYSIKTAIESKLFDRVIISTDDAEIADIAEKFHAEVPFIRSAELSNDHATTIDVMADAVHQLKLAPQDLVCCIYATAPFLVSDDLLKAFALLNQHNTEVIFSATAFPFPIQRAITLDKKQTVTMLNPEHLTTRSQDLEETFHDAGQFYLATADFFSQQKAIFSNKSKVVILPNYRVVDIDSEEDWKRAELMYQLLKNDQNQ